MKHASSVPKDGIWVRMENARKSMTTAEHGTIKANVCRVTTVTNWTKVSVSSRTTIKPCQIHCARHGKIKLARNAPQELFWTAINCANKSIPIVTLGTNQVGIVFRVTKDLVWKMENALYRMTRRLLILCAESMIGKKRFVFNVRREALRTNKAYALKFLLNAKLRINSSVHRVTTVTS
jgi:hypothetical protein